MSMSLQMVDPSGGLRLGAARKCALTLLVYTEMSAGILMPFTNPATAIRERQSGSSLLPWNERSD